MPVRQDFQPGQFCWIDYAAHDLDAASAWYATLFGWTEDRQETHGGPAYAFFVKDDVPAAAGGQMVDEMKAQGIPPMWNSYVCVEDCEAAEREAAALGATITVPTMEVPGHGKLCFIMDPAGASIAMWQQTGEGPGVRTAEPGCLSWNELMCRDVAGAREFYSKLFGWEYQDLPMDGIEYTLIKSHDSDTGGMMAMDGEQFEGVPNHWMVYFAVADCDAMAAQVAETGGVIMVPPTEIPVGKFSVLRDPQGGVFSIIQTAEHPACD
jgi:predicted enzyme related to lactoylglutathione lyase